MLANILKQSTAWHTKDMVIRQDAPIAPGKLDALLLQHADKSQYLDRQSVNAYLRSRYVHRRKGRSVRRGHRSRPDTIRWVVLLKGCYPTSPPEPLGGTFTVGTDQTLEINHTFTFNPKT